MRIAGTVATTKNTASKVVEALVMVTVWLAKIVVVGWWGLLWGSRTILAFRRGETPELLLAALFGAVPVVWLGIQVYRRALT